MSDAIHSSQIRRKLDITKQRLSNNSVSSKRDNKQKKKKRYRTKTALELISKGCYGCKSTTCQWYIKGLDELVRKGAVRYGCYKL